MPDENLDFWWGGRCDKVDALACVPAAGRLLDAITNGSVLDWRIEMFVSRESMTMLPRCLAGGALVLVVGLLPQGVVFSQDFVAVERRLGNAVAEGEINLAQAEAMMDALRANREIGSHARLKMQLEERMKVYGEMLRKQVADGDISKKEAMERYESAGRKIESHYRQVLTWGQSRERDEHRHGEREANDDSRNERRPRDHQSDEEQWDVEVSEQLRNAVEERLRYHGEDLRAKVATGDINREEMEREYKTVQRRILGEARKAEFERRRDKDSTDAPSERKNDELRELHRGIEARIRQNGERLRQQFAAGKISRERMEEQYLEAERRMWNYYRQAELKMERERRGAGRDNESEAKDDESDQEEKEND